MTRICIPLFTLVLATGCFSERPGSTGDAVKAATTPTAENAKVVMKKSDGTELGTIELEPTLNGVRIQGQLAGLAPGAQHAFHVHENTTCGEGDFKAAGGHFAPDGNPHGAPGKASHAGDLGNIEVGDDGVAVVAMVTDDLDLDGPASAMKHAVVLHAGVDDLASQPSGDAGSRLACGTIEAD